MKSIQIGDGVNSAEEKEICKTKRADFMTVRIFECGFKDYSSLAIAIAEIITHFDFNYKGDDILLIEKMSEEAIEMVKKSIDSFVNKDGTLAANVIKHDTVVDKYFFTIKDTLIHEIKSSENDASYSLDLLMIAKYLERIGDHSCNVARCTQYMLTGKLTGQE